MRKKFDIYPFLDLVMDQPNGDIIQIGCVIGNIYTGEIVGSFDSLVNPGHEVSQEIIKLTGLNPDDIRAADSLSLVIDRFNEFFLEMIGKESSNHCFSWGGNDAKYLHKRAELINKKLEITPNSEDVKPVLKLLRRVNNQHTQGGMAKYMSRLNLNFLGKKHNGFDDAYNLFRLYCLMVKIFSQLKA